MVDLWRHNMADVSDVTTWWISDVTTWRTCLMSQHGGSLWHHTEHSGSLSGFFLVLNTNLFVCLQGSFRIYPIPDDNSVDLPQTMFTNLPPTEPEACTVRVYVINVSVHELSALSGAGVLPDCFTITNSPFLWAMVVEEMRCLLRFITAVRQPRQPSFAFHLFAKG